jgi:hypothetical protein
MQQAFQRGSQRTADTEKRTASKRISKFNLFTVSYRTQHTDVYTSTSGARTVPSGDSADMVTRASKIDSWDKKSPNTEHRHKVQFLLEFMIGRYAYRYCMPRTEFGDGGQLRRHTDHATGWTLITALQTIFVFSETSRVAVEPTPPNNQWGPAFFPEGKVAGLWSSPLTSI